MPPDLVDKGLQQDALGAGLHVHGPEGWAHPPGAGGREKGEAAGSSGQRVLRLSSVRASVCLASSPRSRGPGRSAGSKERHWHWKRPGNRLRAESTSAERQTAGAQAGPRPRRPPRLRLLPQQQTAGDTAGRGQIPTRRDWPQVSPNYPCPPLGGKNAKPR